MGKYTKIKQRVYKEVCARVEKVEVVEVVKIKKKYRDRLLDGDITVNCADYGDRKNLSNVFIDLGIDNYNGTFPLFDEEVNGFRMLDRTIVCNGMTNEVNFKDVIKTKKKIKASFFTDKIAVNCTSKKQARKFLKRLRKDKRYKSNYEKIEICIRKWSRYNSETCYVLEDNYILGYGGTEWFGNSVNDWVIVSYKDILEVE